MAQAKGRAKAKAKAKAKAEAGPPRDVYDDQGTLDLLRSKWIESKRGEGGGSWSRCWRGLLERWRGRPLQEPEPEFLTPREAPMPLLQSNHTLPEFGSCESKWEGRGRTMERRTSSRREWWACVLFRSGLRRTLGFA